jgi:hypothetical protein
LRVKADTNEPILGQQKLAHTILLVALMPGWWMLWSESTAADLNLAGSSGLKVPVETSPNTSAAPYFLDTMDNEGETNMLCTSGQASCAKESSKKSMGCASATGVWTAACRGGSDVKLAGGTERTGKSAAGTSTTCRPTSS